jgi:hypothetical protein
MSLADWLTNTRERFDHLSVCDAVRVSAARFRDGATRRLGFMRDEWTGGTNIYDLPAWDTLIVLDACRPDIMRAVSREYAWLDTGGMETYETVGGYSLDWLESTFTPARREHMANSTFTAWNPYTEFTDIDYADAFAAYRAVHDGGWDDDMGCVPPAAVVEAACDIHDPRRRNIVWLMQPHTPYRTLVGEVETLRETEIGNEDNGRETVWNLLRRGDIAEYEAVIACADTLRWALDELEHYLRGLPAEADVYVTSDHGELFGVGGRLGHPQEHYADGQLQVPLMPVDQTRVGEGVEYGGARSVGSDASDQLAALGYTEGDDA